MENKKDLKLTMKYNTDSGGEVSINYDSFLLVGRETPSGASSGSLWNINQGDAIKALFVAIDIIMEQVNPIFQEAFWRTMIDAVTEHCEKGVIDQILNANKEAH